jgi:GNAT superfamily N-acetyltransferase
MFTIRPATSADVEALVAGNLAMARETESVQLDRDTVRAGIHALTERHEPGEYWVAVDGDRIIGQLLVTFEWSDWRNRMVWWIQSVYVAPHARRRGIFRALYEHAKQEARAQGAGGLRLYVDLTNGRAQAVYAALGMKGDHYRVFEDMFAEPPRVP